MVHEEIQLANGGTYGPCAYSQECAVDDDALHSEHVASYPLHELRDAQLHV